MLGALNHWLRLDPKRRNLSWNQRYLPLFERASGGTGLSSMGCQGPEIPTGQRALVQRLIEPIPSGGQWLDVGCGQGGATPQLLERAERVSGLDLDAALISHATQHYGGERARFYCGDADRIPLPLGSFQAVICLESAHCFRELPQFLHQAWAMLAPGGYLAVADFTTSPEHHQLADKSLVHLVSRALAGAQLHPMESWLGVVQRLGFAEIGQLDLTSEMAPMLPLWAEALSAAGADVGHRPTAALLSKTYTALAERGSGSPLRYMLLWARKPLTSSGIQLPV